MSVTDDYLEYVLDQLSDLGVVVPKKMFGAIGLYCNTFFFGILDENTLYFKVDDGNRPDYEVEDMQPFKPFGDDELILKSYYEVPFRVIEHRDELLEWAAKSVDVAQRNPKKKLTPSKKKTKTK